jgi:hypothetical protein
MGDAVNKPRVLPDQPGEDLVLTAVLTVVLTVVLAVPNRRRAAQNRLSRHHSSGLTHEDRPGTRFVQEFLFANLSENVRRHVACNVSLSREIPFGVE